MTEINSCDDDSDVAVQMIGTLPPWKGISAYCKALFEGIDSQWGRLKFTGWRSLYPKTLYPGGDPMTDDEPTEGERIDRPLAWYDPISWLQTGFDADVDLIHAQWWSYPLAIPYIVIFLAAKLLDKTILLTVHNVAPHEQTRLNRYLNNAVYRFADQYIVHSEENRSKLVAETRIDSDDVYVIQHPAVGPQKQGITQTEARSDLGFERDAAIVLFFGSIREYKGLKSLLAHIAELNAERDVNLVIAGQSWVDWSEYEDLIDEYEIGNQVHRYPGHIPQTRLETFFTAADVIALPYEHFDAQSGVAELARHFETPSVGYDVGGLGDQVDIVATDRSEFEHGLVAALDGEVELQGRDRNSVRRHIELYEELLTSTQSPEEQLQSAEATNQSSREAEPHRLSGR